MLERLRFAAKFGLQPALLSRRLGTGPLGLHLGLPRHLPHPLQLDDSDGLRGMNSRLRMQHRRAIAWLGGYHLGRMLAPSFVGALGTLSLSLSLDPTVVAFDLQTDVLPVFSLEGDVDLPVLFEILQQLDHRFELGAQLFEFFEIFEHLQHLQRLQHFDRLLQVDLHRDPGVNLGRVGDDPMQVQVLPLGPGPPGLAARMRPLQHPPGLPSGGAGFPGPLGLAKHSAQLLASPSQLFVRSSSLPSSLAILGSTGPGFLASQRVGIGLGQRRTVIAAAATFRGLPGEHRPFGVRQHDTVLSRRVGLGVDVQRQHLRLTARGGVCGHPRGCQQHAQQRNRQCTQQPPGPGASLAGGEQTGDASSQNRPRTGHHRRHGRRGCHPLRDLGQTARQCQRLSGVTGRPVVAEVLRRHRQPPRRESVEGLEEQHSLYEQCDQSPRRVAAQDMGQLMGEQALLMGR